MAWYWIVAIVLGGLWLLTIVMYLFNLDMKAAAMIQPLINKHYDKRVREPRS